ncbi:MAG: hypothetical protein AB7I27_03170 [Bacteriovoracaceae bacterium]
MKWAVIILLIHSIPLWAAKDRQLLKCLGAEEKRLHLKKDTGPLYVLNQRLIEEIVQIPEADISEENFKQICMKPYASESWKLLEASIQQGKSLFIIPEGVGKMQKPMIEGMIDDYIEATKEILLNFISQIQSASPSATCLKEEIPELDSFFTDIKYLQEDVDLKKLFEGRDLKIFEKLKDYPSAFKRCQERLKKKAKSKSTPSAKKP